MSRIIEPYGERNFLSAEAALNADTGKQVNFQNAFNPSNLDSFTIEVITELSGDVTFLSKSPNSIGRVAGNLSITFGGETKTFGSLNTGTLYHIHITYDGSDFIGYIAGIGSSQTYTGGDFSNASNWLLQNNQNGLVRFYNKILSQEEINKLLKEPYAPRSSLHANIVGEWIPRRSYFKDVGNIYGLGANSVLWFDSVDQYNYAKGSPITPQHGVMTGWPDSEIVTFPEPTEVKDFYDISVINDWTDDGGATEKISGLPPNRFLFELGLNPGGNAFSDNDYRRCTSQSSLPAIGTGDYTLFFIGSFYALTAGNRVNGVFGGVDTLLSPSITAGFNTLEFGPTGGGIPLEFDTYYLLAITRKGTEKSFFINGNFVGSQVESTDWTTVQQVRVGFLISGSSTPANANYVQIGWFRRALSLRELRGLFKNIQFTPQVDLTACDLFVSFNEFFDDAGTDKVVDQSGNGNNMFLTNFTPAQLNPADPAYMVKDIDTLR